MQAAKSISSPSPFPDPSLFLGADQPEVHPPLCLNLSPDLRTCPRRNQLIPLARTTRIIFRRPFSSCPHPLFSYLCDASHLSGQFPSDALAPPFWELSNLPLPFLHSLSRRCVLRPGGFHFLSVGVPPPFPPNNEPQVSSTRRPS